ncbi:MAG: NAD(P)H-dependent oxidoreductase subunit E [Myxococcales bacterium]|nr:NAD(P)H-dependent oxidoreductase subunit E [Myxococcales bacterium]
MQTAPLSDAAKQKLNAVLSRYPNAMAACLPALHLARAEYGHLGDDVVKLVADHLALPVAHVHGVVTFYTMFRREPSGQNVLRVCTNISCMLRGGYEILGAVERELGIKPGQTTPDGCFTLIEEECLAACANAPMMICGARYFLDLVPEKMPELLAELRQTPQTELV